MRTHNDKPLFGYLDPEADPSHPDFDEDSYHDCPACGKPTINARTRAMKGDRKCTKCTSTRPYKGCMDYSHKTGGVLMYTEDPAVFKKIRKPINQQR